MKKSILFALAVFVLLTACMTVSLGAPTTVPAIVDAPIQPANPTASDTPSPSATPLPTNTLVPTALPPTVTPTLTILPQQWNGIYRQTGIGSISIIIIIEKIKGNFFTGKMVWTGKGKFRGATTIISGEFVTDFGDAVEQAKWGKHPDYTGDLNGVWLKWTETGFVQGRGYTLGGWYYGHIDEDNSMTGIYFLNKDISSFASSDFWKLELK